MSKVIQNKLENRLITKYEFHKITALNRKTYFLGLAELMA
ncbi:SHOCT domain-containing protein [Anaerotignum sp.]